MNNPIGTGADKEPIPASRKRNLLATRNGRFLTFGLMYISEGIPYGFSSVAMVALMRQQGLALDMIGLFMSALFLPWGFKWAWAPLIDLVKLDRLGGRRAWIIFCTSMMIITLGFLALIDFQTHFKWLLPLIVLNNIFCATQDVAIDSLAVSTLRPNERARGNGFMFSGMYLGITLGGGVAVFVYGLLGFDAALFYICGLMILNLVFVVRYVHDPHADPSAVRQAHMLRKLTTALIEFVREVYVSFWKSGPGPMVGVAFSLLPIGAMALAYATLGTMLVDYGLNENQIAQIRIYNTLATALGCIGGGMLADRFGTRRITALAFFLTALPTLVLGLKISAVGLSAIPMASFYSLIIVHGLFFGMVFGVRCAIFMGMTNPAVAATQFTAFMAMSNLAVSFGNFWQGYVAEWSGYANVLYLDAAFALLVILVIPFLQGRKEKSMPRPEQVEAAMVDSTT